MLPREPSSMAAVIWSTKIFSFLDESAVANYSECFRRISHCCITLGLGKLSKERHRAKIK